MLGDVVVSWDAARRRAAAAAAAAGAAAAAEEAETEDDEAELWRLVTGEPPSGGPDRTVRPLLVHGVVSLVGVRGKGGERE
jgi:hypothetical protein